MMNLIRRLLAFISSKQSLKGTGLVVAAVLVGKALPPDPAGLYESTELPGSTIQQAADDALAASGFTVQIDGDNVTITGTHAGHSVTTTEKMPASTESAEQWVLDKIANLKEMADGL